MLLEGQGEDEKQKNSHFNRAHVITINRAIPFFGYLFCFQIKKGHVDSAYGTDRITSS